MIRRPPRSTILTAELRVLAEAQGFVEGGGGGEVGHGEADEEGLGHAWLRRLGCSSGGCRTARSEHPSCSTCTPDAAPLIGGAIELLKLKLPGRTGFKVCALRVQVPINAFEVSYFLSVLHPRRNLLNYFSEHSEFRLFPQEKIPCFVLAG